MNKQEIEKAIKVLKTFDCGIDKDLYDAIEVTVPILEQQLTNGWIPVSERLPEKSDVYLATFLEEGKRYVERFYYSDFMGWMMPVAWQDEGRIENIIAWQPLPEPYREDGVNE